MIPLRTDELLNLDYDGLMELGQEPRKGFIKHCTTPVALDVSSGPIMTMADIKPVDIPTVSLTDIQVLPCLAQAAMGEVTHRIVRVCISHRILLIGFASSFHIIL